MAAVARLMVCLPFDKDKDGRDGVKEVWEMSVKELDDER